MRSTDKTARIAGAAYLSLALITPFVLLYIPGKLIVSGNATQTAQNVLAHETLFRFGIVAGLFSTAIFICVAVLLYRLLRDVHKTTATLMLGLVLVSATVGFANNLNHLAALTLFRGENFLTVFDKPQLDALGMLFLRLHSQADYMNEILWGLWLLPLGLLVFWSGFLPRFIGVWLIINCFAYVALSIIALMFPALYGVALSWATPLLLGELVLALWLLVKGAKMQPRAVAASAST
ncbi:MAG: DUF4386 domain-containing protein [Spartobacteria bacterium]